MQSIKLKSYAGENISDFCAEILVDDENLESDLEFKPEPLGYINCIFEDTSDSILCLWQINKYKDVMEPINKIILCDLDGIQP